MNWIEVCIFTVSEAIDEISGFLYDLDITGLVIQDTAEIANFLENNDKSWDYIDDELVKKCNDESCIKFYVSEDEQGKEKLALVINAIDTLKQLKHEMDLGRLDIKITNVSESDWANNWKKYYKPLKIGDKIVIKPSWEEYTANDNDLVIDMDPGMAFGTGTHETTCMCIELLQKYVKLNDTVFDIGCGSGILSITSAMLGAKKVIGVDFDSVAVAVAKDNVNKNMLDDKIEIKSGDLTDVISGEGNIVVANIIADVIIKLTNNIQNFIIPQGIFISSGIIKERTDDVRTALKNKNYEILETMSKGEWVAIVARVKSNA